MSDVDWGTAPAWFGAASTSLAFVIAAVAFLRQTTDRRTEQARRVCCWPVEVTELRTETGRGVLVGPGDGQSVRVRVRNTSELPVYDLAVWVHFSYDPEAPRSGSHQRVIVPPGDTDVWADWVDFPASGLADDPFVDLTFRDSSGRRWQRLHDGSFGPDQLSRDGLSRRRISFRRRRRRLD